MADRISFVRGFSSPFAMTRPLGDPLMFMQIEPPTLRQKVDLAYAAYRSGRAFREQARRLQQYAWAAADYHGTDALEGIIWLDFAGFLEGALWFQSIARMERLRERLEARAS